MRRAEMVAHTVRRAEPPLRLTRRGRAVVLVLLALVACAASVVLFTTASRASVDPSNPARCSLSRVRDHAVTAALILRERDEERRSVAAGTPHVLSRKIRRVGTP